MHLLIKVDRNNKLVDTFGRPFADVHMTQPPFGTGQLLSVSPQYTHQVPAYFIHATTM